MEKNKKIILGVIIAVVVVVISIVIINYVSELNNEAEMEALNNNPEAKTQLFLAQSDVNNDNLIDRSELITYFNSSSDPESIADEFLSYDSNNDNALNKNELFNYMSNTT
ncbi:hypothetical protein MBBAR_1c02640 [Methanobrevibacter arboriphilus JCM 13429 = DSM 1125]|uniref:EF-hand domain-containing protein n=2 Tax=Methanobrevibacter arboriphilus TaxID=39441 RepID=A0A1V6N5C3_METAZ|nr:hypothetical protein [Methanobrevibacter arboriphilus]OQD59855.1 hypothetical protein MBBAR_1c02640 [Methanobrevibacter arboriphilus JCM 13429 = DSM 1125]